MNKLILAQSSKLLRPLFATTCDCPSFNGLNFDILCPDFHPSAMASVLDLLFSGETFIDQEMGAEIGLILKALQINIELAETR